MILSHWPPFIYLSPFQFFFRGLWNVPFVSNSYLINATLFKKYDRSKITFTRNNLDPDMALCANLRDLDVFMYVSNRLDFGHLINPETYDVTRANPDMYQIFENVNDWEDRYIHVNYPDNFLADKKIEQVRLKLIALLFLYAFFVVALS